MNKSKPKLSFLVSLTASLLTAGYLTLAVDTPDQRINQGKADLYKSYQEGQVLVIFEKGVRAEAVRTLASSRAFRIAKEFKTLSRLTGKQYVWLTSAGKSTQAMMQELQQVRGIEKTEANYFVFTDAVPNDTLFPQMWQLNNTGQMGGTVDADIDAPEAWNVTAGSASVIIADVDTGADYGHPDLKSSMWVNPAEISGNGFDDDGNGYVDDVYGINAITGSGDPLDDSGHGSHTAGTIAAAGNNGQGVAGVAYQCKIMALKFISAAGSGTIADAVKCLDYVLDQKVNRGQNIVAVNASWGGGGENQTLYDAIKALGDQNIIFVASAGNGGTDNDSIPQYPASYNLFNIISVTTTDNQDAQKFNYGLNTVDIGAPGYNILSTINGGYAPAVGDVFFDNMEAGADKWETGGTLNTWAISENQEVFANTSYPVPSPTHFWSDSPAVNYQGNTDSWLAVKNPIDLTAYVGQKVCLVIGAAYAFLVDDHGYTEISKDNGETWTAVGDFTNAGYYWNKSYIWVIPDDYKTANFKFRFHVVTDAATAWAGWLIDNVGICTKISYDYALMSGTSMSAPHVTGAVGLVATQFPAEPMYDHVLRVLMGGDSIASLSGKCSSGKRLNLLGSLSLNVILPYLITITPEEYLTPGTSFTLTGCHFKANPGSVVWVDTTGNETACAVTSWADMEIVAVSPNVPYGKYTVVVKNEAGVKSFNSKLIDSWPKGNPIFSEDFKGDFLGSGWSVVDNAATGLVWTRNDLIGSANTSGGSGNCATANSDKQDTQGLGMDTNLISPAVLLNPGFDRIVLSFRHFFYFYTGSAAVLDISTDNGSTWANLATWNISKGPAREVFELNDYRGKTVKFRFHYSDGKVWGWYWDLDDVQVLTWGVPTPIKDDIVGSWSGMGVWNRNSGTGEWSRIVAQDAVQVVTGDFDGDKAADILGWWTGAVDGIWLRYANGTWAKLINADNLVGIAAGDLNGDGKDDLVGSWSFGIWWRDSQTGNWAELNPLSATALAAGDLDCDGKDDVVGSWLNAGVWALMSGTQNLQLTSDCAKSLALGDYNADGKVDLIGSWSYGTWLWDNTSGNWSLIFNSAEQVASGDIDGDGRADLLGYWLDVPGLWVRYSATGNWEQIHELAPSWVTAGKLR